MMSTRLIYMLIVAYLAISACAVWERHWARCLYFMSATGISVAVLMMTERAK